MKADRKDELAGALAEAVFSDKFRKRTAGFTALRFTAGALGVAAGCVGVWAYGSVACDPLLYQHHPEHIEEVLVSTLTAPLSLSSADVILYPRFRRSS